MRTDCEVLAQMPSRKLQSKYNTCDFTFKVLILIMKVNFNEYTKTWYNDYI